MSDSTHSLHMSDDGARDTVVVGRRSLLEAALPGTLIPARPDLFARLLIALGSIA